MPALSFDTKTSLGLGVTEILLGIFSGVFGILAILCLSSYGYIGYGLWCGMMFIIAGSVSSAAGSRPNNDLVTASVTTNIIALIFAITLMALAGLGLYSNLTMSSCSTCTAVSATPFCSQWTSVVCIDETGYLFALTTEIVLLLIGVIETVISVVAASLGCGCHCNLNSAVVPGATDVVKYPMTVITPQSPAPGTTKARYHADETTQWDPSYALAAPKRYHPEPEAAQQWDPSYGLAPKYTETETFNPGYVTSRN